MKYRTIRSRWTHFVKVKFQDYEKWLRIRESDLGRDSGWTIYRNSIPVATLTDARYEDMFWVSYLYQGIVADAPSREDLCAIGAGFESHGIEFKSREFPEEDITGNTIVTLSPEEGRITVRSLHLAARSINGWDRIILDRRARKRNSRGCNDISMY